MPTQQIVVIGTSAGGIDALRRLAADFPHDFNAPIAVVMHTAPESPGMLHEILGRAGSLPTVMPTDGERLLPGRIYVAPPDRHMVVEPGRVRITRGPKENRFRPAIDPLFRSAAQVFGPAAIGVILTGNLDDGTAGLWAIKKLGGTTIVQDPSDAMHPSMPQSALRHVAVDHVAMLADIAPLLTRLTAVPVSEPAPHTPLGVEAEVMIAKEQNAIEAGVERLGTPARYSCPECGGVLIELKEGNRVRFRCHTGHAYSAESLRAAIDEGIEESLWNAIRLLEEGDLLMRQLGEHLQAHHGASGQPFVERAAGLHRQSEVLREMVNERSSLVTSD